MPVRRFIRCWLSVGCLLAAGLSGPAGAEETVTPLPHPDDPWERWNRKVYVFNDTVDRYVFKPVAEGYQWLMPRPVDNAITNVFDNLLEVRVVLNQLLQGKFLDAGRETGRFLLNSTLGVAGIFDVATPLGLNGGDEDFGQTLGRWGVDSGPYLMLPFLGPSTVRDAGSLPVDWLTNPVREVDDVPTRNTAIAVERVDRRADLLRAEELMMGDRYAFLRDTYLQRREYLVKDGEVEDTFGDEDF